MSLVQHNVCKLKDGRELNFDSALQLCGGQRRIRLVLCD